MAVVSIKASDAQTLEQMVFYLLFYRQEWVYSREDCSENHVFPTDSLMRHGQWLDAQSPVTCFVKFPDTDEGDELAVWFRLKF